MSSNNKQICSTCGSTNLTLNDGFLYCGICGSLFNNFVELEHENDTPVLGINKIKIKKTVTDKSEHERKGETKKRTRNKMDKMKEMITSRSDFIKNQLQYSRRIDVMTPTHLYRVGLRISVFTQILKRSIHILINEMNFPTEISDVSFAVFQAYLNKCEIAFCPEELPKNDEEKLISIVQNIHFKSDEAAIKKQKLADAKAKGLKKLNESESPWQLLTQGSINENLEFDNDSEEEEEEEDNIDTTILNISKTEIGTSEDITNKYFNKIPANISKNATKRASQIMLNLEILATIIYISILGIGCSNIFLFDVIRWIREDRFRISTKEIMLCYRGGHEKINKKTEQGEQNSSMDYRLSLLQLPLHEIARTFSIFNQTVDLSKNLIKNRFEKFASRIIENLNLPNEILFRMILIESIIPCDLNIYSRQQGNVDNGFNFLDLFNMKPNMMYDEFMLCFGKRDRVDYEVEFEDIILSNEVKIMAYLLFVMKMTFDLDSNKVTEYNENCPMFDLDTWIHQLEMRFSYWDGHDLPVIFRSTCKVPILQEKLPFDNYFPRRNNSVGSINRLKRQAFFRSCAPTDMSTSSTQSLPTVFMSRDDFLIEDRNGSEAILSPLNFQKNILKKELEELDENDEKCLDKKSIRTFFKCFKSCIVTESKKNFSEIFPASQNYSKFSRPDYTSCCTFKRNRIENDGEHQIFLSLKVCDDLFMSASPSFSRRFHFLLKYFSKLIGEDVKTLYAAFLMVEMNFLETEKLDEYRTKLITGQVINIVFAKYRIKGTFPSYEMSIKSANLIDNIKQLNTFHFSKPRQITKDDESLNGSDREEEEEEENDEEGEEGGGGEEEEEEANNEIDIYKQILEKARCSNSKSRVILRNAFYNFDHIFSLLAIKYW